MKDLFKFIAIIEPNIPERKYVINANNFYQKYFIGFDGIVYENYGTEDKPLWENVFDSSYDLEIVLKTAKMIIGNDAYQIKITQAPILVLNEKINEDGTRELCDNQKWQPLKFEFISKYDKSINGNHDEIIILGNDIFRLNNCNIDLENNLIIFDKCFLINEKI